MKHETALHALFPNIESFRSVNLDTLLRGIASGSSPFHHQTIINAYHKDICAVTYGGWMEDRSRMWKGTYLDDGKKYTHLGVDINVPANTPVISPFDASIVDVLQDQDTQIGWGGRVIVKPEHGPYFIFAHLDRRSIARLKDRVVRGQQIGRAGTWPYNGNLFEHVHVQAVRAPYFENLTSLDEIDGYATPGILIRARFPEPLGEISRLL